MDTESPAFQKLSADGNIIREPDGTIIATASGEKAAAYTRLFVISTEMLAFLEAQVTQAADEFEQAYNDAERFNTVAELASQSRRDAAYPDMPDWIKTGLDLLARAKGEEGGADQAG